MVAAHTRGGALRRSSTAMPISGRSSTAATCTSTRSRPPAPAPGGLRSSRSTPRYPVRGRNRLGSTKVSTSSDAAASAVLSETQRRQALVRVLGRRPERPEGDEHRRCHQQCPQGGSEPTTCCASPATYPQPPSADGFEWPRGTIL